jgi:hypothetical protein
MAVSACIDSMKSVLHRTGLPQFDQESYNKGLSDGTREAVWWPGAGTEPLSYTVGYREAGMRNPRTEPDSSGKSGYGHALEMKIFAMGSHKHNK